MTMSGTSESENRMLGGITSLPLASAADIAACQRLTISGVYARLRALREWGLVESVNLGLLFPPVERFFLTEPALREMGLVGATWHQPGGLIRLLERLSSVEALYQAAAVIDGLGELRDFQWMDAISFDACVRYQLGWMVFFWVGILRSEASFVERMEQFGNDLLALATNDPHPRPSLVCCVARDLWQVELVQRVVRRFGMTDWVRVWCIADGTWHGARDVQRGRGWVHQPVVPLPASRGAWDRRVGDSLWNGGGEVDAAGLVGRVMPAIESAHGGKDASRTVRRAMRSIRSAEGPREAAAILRNMVATLDAWDPGCEAAGIVRRAATYLESPTAPQDIARILSTVAEWPGITTSMVRLALGEGPSGRRAQNGCIQLTDLGLLRRWRQGTRFRYRLSWEGMKLLADLDRVNPTHVWTRIQMDRWETIGKHQAHEYGLLDLVFQFVAAGCQVAAGWRDWELLGADGGIDPDAMVLLRQSPYGPGWHYIEYERSAKSPSRISQKLRGYDSPMRANSWPVLMAISTGKAEMHCQEVGREMKVPMATTTIPRLRKYGAVGAEECWSVYGRPGTLS